VFYAKSSYFATQPVVTPLALPAARVVLQLSSGYVIEIWGFDSYSEIEVFLHVTASSSTLGPTPYVVILHPKFVIASEIFTFVCGLMSWSSNKKHLLQKFLLWD
jgi:hypothetical protein